MSLNFTVASAKFILCTTDRRLTNLKTGEVVSERSTKLTHFTCADATGLITYNGIGRLDGMTPSDWLAELPSFDIPFPALVQSIKNDCERRITRPANLDSRHSFVIGAIVNVQPHVVLVSNYEHFETGSAAKARTSFDISFKRMSLDLPLTDPPAVEVIATGATNSGVKKAASEIFRMVQQGAERHCIKARCVKATRDRSYGDRRRASVGTSVLWAIVDSGNRKSIGGLDVVGGTAQWELPNVLSPIVRTKDLVISSFPINTGETSCPKCRTSPLFIFVEKVEDENYKNIAQ
jgi:hypothetical protein